MERIVLVLLRLIYAVLVALSRINVCCLNQNRIKIQITPLRFQKDTTSRHPRVSPRLAFVLHRDSAKNQLTAFVTRAAQCPIAISPRHLAKGALSATRYTTSS